MADLMVFDRLCAAALCDGATPAETAEFIRMASRLCVAGNRMLPDCAPSKVESRRRALVEHAEMQGSNSAEVLRRRYARQDAWRPARNGKGKQVAVEAWTRGY